MKTGQEKLVSMLESCDWFHFLLHLCGTANSVSTFEV